MTITPDSPDRASALSEHPTFVKPEDIAAAQASLKTMLSSLRFEEGFGIGLNHQYVAQALRAAALYDQLKAAGAIHETDGDSLLNTLMLSTGTLNETFVYLADLKTQLFPANQEGSDVIGWLHSTIGQLTTLSIRDPENAALAQVLAKVNQAHDIVVTAALNKANPDDRLYADRAVETRMEDVSTGVGSISFSTVNFEIFLEAAQPVGKALRLIEEAHAIVDANPALPALPPPAGSLLSIKTVPPVGNVILETEGCPLFKDDRLMNTDRTAILDRLNDAHASLLAALNIPMSQIPSDKALQHPYETSMSPRESLELILAKVGRASNLLAAYAMNQSLPPDKQIFIDEAACQQMEDIRASVPLEVFERNYTKYLAVVQPVGESLRLIQHCSAAIVRFAKLPPHGFDEETKPVLEAVLKQNGFPATVARALRDIVELSYDDESLLSLRRYLNDQHKFNFEDLQVACREWFEFIQKYHSDDPVQMQHAELLNPDSPRFNPARAHAQAGGGYQCIGEQLTHIPQDGLSEDFRSAVRLALDIDEALGKKILPENPSSLAASLISAYETILAKDIHAVYPEWAIPEDTLPWSKVAGAIDRAVVNIAIVKELVDENGDLMSSLDALKEKLVGKGYAHEHSPTSHLTLRDQVTNYLKTISVEPVRTM